MRNVRERAPASICALVELPASATSLIITPFSPTSACRCPLIRYVDKRMWKAVLILSICQVASAFVPLIDGGKGIPKLYDGYFNEQIAKQASTAVAKAIGAGKVSLA